MGNRCFGKRMQKQARHRAALSQRVQLGSAVEIDRGFRSHEWGVSLTPGSAKAWPYSPDVRAYAWPAVLLPRGIGERAPAGLADGLSRLQRGWYQSISLGQSKWS
jgi:hypothetical protein